MARCGSCIAESGCACRLKLIRMISSHVLSPMTPSKEQIERPFQSDVGLYFFATGFPLVLSIVGMVWVLRLVSPADFGTFNLVSATAAIVATAGFHWLCQWMLRYGFLFMEPGSQAGYWSVLWRSSAAVLAVLLCTAPLVMAVHPAWRNFIIATFFLCVTQGMQSLVTTLLQGTGHAKEYTIAYAVSSAVRWLVTILLCQMWLPRPGLWWTLVLGQIASQLAAIVIAVVSVRHKVVLRFTAPDSRQLQSEAFSYGAPFLVWAISMQLLNVADRYVIQGFRGSHEVGLYSAIYNVANASVMILTNPILLASAPRIFQRAGAADCSLHSNEGVRRMTDNCLQLLLMIGAPMVSWSVILRREVVVTLLGQQYAQAAPLFPAIVLGALLWQLGQTYQKGFETAARTKPIGGSIVYAVGVNLLLNFLLVPKFGIAGAAVATVGAYAFYGIVIYTRVGVFGRPEIAARSIINVAAATAISSAMLVTLIRIDSSQWFTIGACLLSFSTYAGILLVCKETILTTQLRQLQRAFRFK
jgi:O-antigen/teichoic acid export membrane protein